ncbi:MAG: hypothetical protein R2864_05395 [Syntrophotaleaceae bacterium]
MVEAGDELLVLAEGLVTSVMKELAIDDYQVVTTFDAKLFERKVCRHPFISGTRC